ncbi:MULTISPECIES: SRPBCC family protein [unclassified Streptomyces]|uniref:SRPBCC family protein n=1 Tax=unclassified Streptomyces TaxID=2593676 RepID=UPI0022B6226C|nr:MULTISPECIES: SRPBCC family protein [unclassified Streptomyces]MCZ7417377.1 SRPBCC family protein [Streptomyces sp. WMMC897]MCZ7432796.1 SRPBCC family protein [Streptomyces sp. WMMC1477]
MARRFTVSESVVVHADARAVYDRLSDPTQMGRWSPENTGATLRPGTDGAGPVAVGTVFDGHNKRGPFRWTTRCTVTEATPGERFAFRVTAIGLRRPVVPAAIATWRYRLETVADGTKVTETWTDDRRWPDAIATVFDKAVTGGKTFDVFHVRNIRTTLRRLKDAMESSTAT